MPRWTTAVSGVLAGAVTFAVPGALASVAGADVVPAHPDVEARAGRQVVTPWYLQVEPPPTDPPPTDPPPTDPPPTEPPSTSPPPTSPPTSPPRTVPPTSPPVTAEPVSPPQVVGPPAPGEVPTVAPAVGPRAPARRGAVGPAPPPTLPPTSLPAASGTGTTVASKLAPARGSGDAGLGRRGAAVGRAVTDVETGGRSGGVLLAPTLAVVLVGALAVGALGARRRSRDARSRRVAWQQYAALALEGAARVRRMLAGIDADASAATDERWRRAVARAQEMDEILVDLAAMAPDPADSVAVANVGLALESLVVGVSTDLGARRAATTVTDAQRSLTDRRLRDARLAAAIDILGERVGVLTPA